MDVGMKHILQMRREGREPNAFTYASILNGSASAGGFGVAEGSSWSGSPSGTGVRFACGQCAGSHICRSGYIDDARQIFYRIEKRDLVTRTVMIGGLAQHGCGHVALELFRKMNAELVKPNGTTFVALLSACCHEGLLDEGRRLLSAMTQDYGIEPDIVHYNCMVALFGRAGHLEEAKQFITAVLPVEPNGRTWTSLLRACRTYSNVEFGKFAAEEVLKLDPNAAGGYVLLFKIYAASGKWDKVSLVRTMMQTRRSQGVAGLKLITRSMNLL